MTKTKHMLRYSEARVEGCFIDYIGSYADNEDVRLSANGIVSFHERTENVLKDFLFKAFEEAEYYSFDFSDGNFQMNPLYQYAEKIFQDKDEMNELHGSISKYLYNNSRHPQIKPGELLQVYVSDLLIDDQMVDAYCIFKVEEKDAFLKLQSDKILVEEGMLPGKVDKACIIFNMDGDDGYRLCVADRTSAQSDAQFWKEAFLNVKQRADDYYHTKNYILTTKQFIKERLKPLYDIERTEEAEIMNRCKTYMKSAETFDKGEYEQEVFYDEKVIEDFRQFQDDLMAEKQTVFVDKFEVKQQAVKRYQKVFKSVIKLDKNFHIYIHGNRSMIEKGTDEEGRKFYKIFYNEEK